MPPAADPAEILARLYAAGFEVQASERYPRAIMICREECVALLEAAPEGPLRYLGTPGWKIGENVAVRTIVNSRPVFQFKETLVEATPERESKLQAFRLELDGFIGPGVHVSKV